MRQVFKIQSTITLKSGDQIEQEDFVLVSGGMLTAAEKVKKHHMRMRFRDANYEWSDVVKVEPHHATPICDLTI